MLISPYGISTKKLQKKEKKMFEKEKVGMDLEMPHVCQNSLNH